MTDIRVKNYFFHVQFVPRFYVEHVHVWIGSTLVCHPSQLRTISHQPHCSSHSSTNCCERYRSTKQTNNHGKSLLSHMNGSSRFTQFQTLVFRSFPGVVWWWRCLLRCRAGTRRRSSLDSWSSMTRLGLSGIRLFSCFQSPFTSLTILLLTLQQSAEAESYAFSADINQLLSLSKFCVPVLLRPGRFVSKHGLTLDILLNYSHQHILLQQGDFLA